jgi:uncharacterized protein YecT (DUF1311 family)
LAAFFYFNLRKSAFMRRILFRKKPVNHLSFVFMKKFIVLVAAALMAMNVSAEDKPKKGKGAKINPAYQQLLADLKLTDEQKPEFQALQKEQSAFMAEQKKRSAEEKKTAGQPFYKARTAKIKELFNQDQLKIWWKYQAEQRTARQKKSQ